MKKNKLIGIVLTLVLLGSSGAGADERDSYFCLSGQGVGFWSPIDVGYKGTGMKNDYTWCVYIPPKAKDKPATPATPEQVKNQKK